MSTYKEQDAENLLAHLREGIDPDSVSALLDDTRVDCEGTGEGESVWMHLVLPGARYGKTTGSYTTRTRRFRDGP